MCTNRHDPHYEVLTGRLLEHTVQPPQVRVQHPKATDESYMVTTDGGSSLRVTVSLTLTLALALTVNLALALTLSLTLILTLTLSLTLTLTLTRGCLSRWAAAAPRW